METNKQTIQQNKTPCYFVDELWQIMERVQNFREGSNSPANQNLWVVHKLLLVGVHLPTGSQKAVAKVLYSSCSARFHGVDMADLVWKGSKLSWRHHDLFLPWGNSPSLSWTSGRYLCQCSYPTGWTSSISSKNDRTVLPINVVVKKKYVDIEKNNRLKAPYLLILIDLVFLGFLVQWWELIT